MTTWTIPAFVKWHGVDAPPAAQRVLRAGPLTVVLDGLDLRYIRLGDREIVRRVYVAVRDPNWHTVPAVYSNVRIQAGEASFDVSFDARHQDGEIDFAWHGTIQGHADGTVSYSMDGAALRAFKKNRIGFCVLHPMSCAGAPCEVTHVDGSVERGTFPTSIAPHQPFIDFTAITHEVQPGMRAEVRLAGDVFEMEDQRNWTDASFKTYSTPLRLPFPVEITRGSRVVQSVTLTLRGNVPEPVAPASSDGALCIVDADLAATRPLPRLGLGLAGHGQPLSERERVRLRVPRPAHLRVDLDLSTPAYATTLRRAVEQSRALDAPLEVALFVSDDAARELAALGAAMRRDEPRIARWLVFHSGEAVTSARWVDAARQVLAPQWPGIPIGGGSNAYFTQFNRNRPPRGAMDVVSYSINPQVHAFDDASLTETLPAQAATLESARLCCGEAWFAVSPVTLKPRFNPDATAPEPDPAPGELPAQVDSRQMSLFGAGWTLGSIKYLTNGGAGSVTYYETTGWRGVMETEAGSPAVFPSAPGMVFPLYHVLADVAEFADGVAYHCTASHPLLIDALALGDGRRACVLLANMSGEPRQVVVRMPGLRAARLRSLDERSFERATRDAEAFRREEGQALAVQDGQLRLTLLPYALARLDADVAPRPSGA